MKNLENLIHEMKCLDLGKSDVAISFDDPIVSVSYGGIDVDISKFKNVNDLYDWMCSDACDWF